jgi:flagellar basal-body rod modification protein FlgD
MAIPVLDLTSPSGAVAPTTATRQGSSALGKDEFLKLLVAQLANQDPTKPEDSSTFVAQLAQFSALEQQQNTVSRLDTLLLGQATANQTSASAFIGKDVTFHGGSMHLDGLSPVNASATLTTPADKVAIVVTDGAGNPVRTLQLGPQAVGNVAITWDGLDDNGVRLPTGDYGMQAAAFDANQQAVPITLNNSGTVSGVAFQDGVPQLKVGGSLIKMSDVTSINERNTTP